MIRILFVCHGNICRSPMAEFILKSLVEDRGIANRFHIESAAVSDEEFENPIYPPAKMTLQRHNIPYDSAKKARTVTSKDYSEFDLIVCMDKSNIRLLSYILGKDKEKKVRLMMSFCGEDRDVADPWYTRDFETTYKDIHKACEKMLDQI